MSTPSRGRRHISKKTIPINPEQQDAGGKDISVGVLLCPVPESREGPSYVVKIRPMAEEMQRPFLTAAMYLITKENTRIVPWTPGSGVESKSHPRKKNCRKLPPTRFAPPFGNEVGVNGQENTSLKEICPGD